VKIPKSLKKSASKKIWTEITEAWEIDESGMVLLMTALEAYERYLEAKEILDKHGFVYKTSSGQLKKNPALEVEKVARGQFLIAWRMLNLGIDPPGNIGRPGGS